MVKHIHSRRCASQTKSLLEYYNPISTTYPNFKIFFTRKNIFSKSTGFLQVLYFCVKIIYGEAFISTCTDCLCSVKRILGSLIMLIAREERSPRFLGLNPIFTSSLKLSNNRVCKSPRIDKKI